jgi:aminopeptidase N
MFADQLRKVVSALDALILVEQAKLGRELAEKSRLRDIQLGIAGDERRAFESLHGFEHPEAVTYAFQQARVRKLRSMQTDLQPDLARAALRRKGIEGELIRLMRQRLAMKARAESLRAKSAKRGCPDSEARALFEMAKRV